MRLEFHPRQSLAFKALLKYKVQELFFGGAAGGGKSHFLRLIAIILCMEVPGIQIYLFRRLYKDLIRSHLRGPGSFPVLLEEFISDKLVQINYSSGDIVFNNGSRVMLSHIQYESDLDNYLSQEIHVALFDEASTFMEKMFRFIRARVRLGGLEVPDKWQGILPFMVLASNPKGPMHAYLRKGFVKVRRPLTVFESSEADGSARRLFVPSRITDNPTLLKNDPTYINRIKGMGDENIVKAYLEGDWDAVEGAAFPTWDTSIHIIDPFDIPSNWKLKRGYDYGYSAPYSYLTFAVANGEEFADRCGHIRWLPKGSVIAVGELYGDNAGSEQGINENVRVTGRKIRSYENSKFGVGRVSPGPADASIFSVEQGPSIAGLFDSVGITFTPSNKKPGSRLQGLALARQMMEESCKRIPEKPCFLITTDCPRLAEHFASLQIDDGGEDVETKEQPDHDWDVVRYALLDEHEDVMIKKIIGF